jgi:hypothetical protein
MAQKKVAETWNSFSTSRTCFLFDMKTITRSPVWIKVSWWAMMTSGAASPR